MAVAMKEPSARCQNKILKSMKKLFYKVDFNNKLIFVIEYLTTSVYYLRFAPPDCESLNILLKAMPKTPLIHIR